MLRSLTLRLGRVATPSSSLAPFAARAPACWSPAAGGVASRAPLLTSRAFALTAEDGRARDNGGRTPLLNALLRGTVDNARYLCDTFNLTLDDALQVDEHGQSTLHCCVARRGSLAKLEWLCTHFDLPVEHVLPVEHGMLFLLPLQSLTQ